MKVLDPKSFEPARFDGMEEFDHFADEWHPRCFACNSRMMVVRPIAVNDGFVLMPATTMVDDGFVIIPDTWLVYPRAHITQFMDMPDTWTMSLQDAVRILGLEADFNVGDNWGRAAGQTVEHGHTWIMRRSAEDGLLTENTGLATIILRVQQNGITMPETAPGS